MIEARPAAMRLRERDGWFLALDSICCLVRAFFSLEQIHDRFQGTAIEVAGVAILASLVMVTITADTLTARRSALGPRLAVFALLLVVVSLCWELRWTWLHSHSVPDSDLGMTCLVVPVRVGWSALYIARLIDARKAP
jgi:hypothetical protein